jgi:heme oxygenase (biliverdin-IX-beta and delta-forming)
MILAELKEQTREQHENLETIVDVMNKMFTRADYERLLTKFYRFYSAVEPRVYANDLSDSGIVAGERSKIKWLEEDLSALGVLDKAKALPELTDVPNLDSAAKAFGAMYVMEGATLGGQVITRHLKQHLDLTPENGGAFFNSYGHLVGPKWKEFGTAITAFADGHDNNDEIVQSAKDTFDSFARCFSQSSEAST